MVCLSTCSFRTSAWTKKTETLFGRRRFSYSAAVHRYGGVSCDGAVFRCRLWALIEVFVFTTSILFRDIEYKLYCTVCSTRMGEN